MLSLIIDTSHWSHFKKEYIVKYITESNSLSAHSEIFRELGK